MYKIVLIIAMKSILFSQDKMILKGGEEIILLDRTNFIDYDDSYSFIEYKSKYYAKNKIALLILNNSEIIIRSGIPISIYNSLSLEKKAAADKRFSSKDFKNTNYALLGSLDEKDTQTYLTNFNDSSALSGGQKATRVAGTIGCIWLAIGAAVVISIGGVVPMG